MRPERLELEGFGAFRDPTVVDFTGTDLFALTGPTGSGKSTIVDGIVFALYGCVPRYGDRRLVAPAISQGRNEARVRLDFSVGGDTYTAVRVVRRTRTGASTKEARLERAADSEVLAGNEREVGGQVESLLGLTYDHFVKCVVLPQGEFARFLHDKPEKRQELLVELLDLGLYEAMGQLARERDRAARAKVEIAETQLAELAGATPEARETAAARADALRGLRDDFDSELPKLAALDEESKAAAAEAVTAGDTAELLGAIVVPEGIAALGAAVVAASAVAEEAHEEEERALVAVGEADAGLAALPNRAALEAAARAHVDRATCVERRAKHEAELVDWEAAVVAAKAQLDAARQQVDDADLAVRRAEGEHRAHALAAELVVGQDCPVCRQPVTALPEAHVPADLEAARKAQLDAKARVDDATHVHTSAVADRGRVQVVLDELQRQLDQLDAAIAAHADADAVAAALGSVEAAEAAVAEARGRATAASAARVAADKSLAAEQAREADARAGYDQARDRVATLGPPDRTPTLAADWSALAEWAATQAPIHRQRAVDATKRQAELDRDRAARLQSLTERCAELAIAAGRRPLRDAVVEELARVEAAIAQLDRQLADAERLRAQREEAGAEAQLAGALGRHLSARGFEKWVLDEALGLLVAGATEVLLDLSAGRYTLGLEERSSNFAVVDHREADQMRSARTLSGGETFLASLALALALADQLVLLAARGSARLESIFLDEGFGTLDPDTLEVVAAAIEELGSRGRMVGVISHVAELAERVPVRFEVSSTPSGARVERVER